MRKEPAFYSEQLLALQCRAFFEQASTDNAFVCVILTDYQMHVVPRWLVSLSV